MLLFIDLHLIEKNRHNLNRYCRTIKMKRYRMRLGLLAHIRRIKSRVVFNSGLFSVLPIAAAYSA